MSLTETERMLTDALCAFLRGESVDWQERPSPEGWRDLFALASEQHVLPMVFEAVCRVDGAFGDMSVESAKKLTKRQIFAQIQTDSAFWGLYTHLRSLGFHPLVVKGMLCRSVYRDGDHRRSSDEDILIPDGEFEACCNAIREYGMSPDGNDDARTEQEITWVSEGLRIELHRSLFPTWEKSSVLLNGFFDGVHDDAVEYSCGDMRISSMPPGKHLLYLILHAYKHFILSGFGIRQVCDIGLWARSYGDRIDWDALYRECESCHTEVFARAVFGVAGEYLGIEIGLPGKWGMIDVPCEPLLRDLLGAGVYGTSSADRVHSATVTLGAAESDGDKKKPSLLGSVFPPRQTMEILFPELKVKPMLLPVKWGERIIGYIKKGGTSPANSIKIAKERTELLKLYGIIRQETTK